MVRPPAAGASPVPSTPDAGHQPSKHHFSAVAQSFAGVLAPAVQAEHGKLGHIGPAPYTKLGPAGPKAGIVDVIEGDNSQDGVAW